MRRPLRCSPLSKPKEGERRMRKPARDVQDSLEGGQFGSAPHQSRTSSTDGQVNRWWPSTTHLCENGYAAPAARCAELERQCEPVLSLVRPRRGAMIWLTGAPIWTSGTAASSETTGRSSSSITCRRAWFISATWRARRASGASWFRPRRRKRCTSRRPSAGPRRASSRCNDASQEGARARRADRAPAGRGPAVCCRIRAATRGARASRARSRVSRSWIGTDASSG